jgi:uncharacterized protein
MTEDLRDGMRIRWDVPITMDDGIALRADVFRPPTGERFPAILSYGPYAKGMSFQDSRPYAWKRLAETRPEVLKGSSNKYQAWEVPDPER